MLNPILTKRGAAALDASADNGSRQQRCVVTLSLTLRSSCPSSERGVSGITIVTTSKAETTKVRRQSSRAACVPRSSATSPPVIAPIASIADQVTLLSVFPMTS